MPISIAFFVVHLLEAQHLTSRTKGGHNFRKHLQLDCPLKDMTIPQCAQDLLLSLSQDPIVSLSTFPTSLGQAFYFHETWLSLHCTCQPLYVLCAVSVLLCCPNMSVSPICCPNVVHMLLLSLGHFLAPAHVYRILGELRYLQRWLPTHTHIICKHTWYKYCCFSCAGLQPPWREPLDGIGYHSSLVLLALSSWQAVCLPPHVFGTQQTTNPPKSKVTSPSRHLS